MFANIRYFFTRNIMMTILMMASQCPCAGVMGGDGLSGFNPYDGFYIGADIGVSNLLDKESTLILPAQYRLGQVGLVGGGFIGYDFSLSDRIKFGVEGFGNANNLNLSAQQYSLNSEFTVSTKYNAGIRVLPGIEFNPGSVFHVVVGYSNTTFDIKDNGAFGYMDTSVNKNGFQTGIGLTSPIIQNLVLRFDGLYTTYMSQSNRGVTISNPNQYQYYTNDFSTLEGDLSLLYKFNF